LNINQNSIYLKLIPFYDFIYEGDIFTIEEDKDLNDLVKKLLKKNPNERISWKEYFEHQFFKKYEY
jgi:serine/threonine protein kinase